MANTVVFLNAPFRDHEYEQACSRVDRLGQTEVVNIYDVYLDTGKEPNISTRSLDIMAWSKSQVDAMLGTSGTPALAMEELREDLQELAGVDLLNELVEEESLKEGAVITKLPAIKAAVESFSW
jgi:hypothetical protein